MGLGTKVIGLDVTGEKEKGAYFGGIKLVVWEGKYFYVIISVNLFSPPGCKDFDLKIQ